MFSALTNIHDFSTKQYYKDPNFTVLWRYVCFPKSHLFEGLETASTIASSNFHTLPVWS